MGSMFKPAVALAPLTLAVGLVVAPPGPGSANTLTEPAAQAPPAAVAAANPSPACGIGQIIVSPDMTGDGLGDIIAKRSNGDLYLYPASSGGKLSRAVWLGHGWGPFTIHSPGDWNGDGLNDLLAVDDAGLLWLYPSKAWGQLGARKQIGHGWGSLRVIAAGDVTGDGKPDLLAINAAGELLVYAGNGTGGFKTSARRIGAGWGQLEAYGAGDLTRDGKPDLLALDSAGNLMLYAGRGNGALASPVQIGHGWNPYYLAAGADLTGDGVADLVGRDNASGLLWLYPGKGNGRLAASKQIGTGWNGSDSCPAKAMACQVSGHQTVVYLDPGHGANVTPRAATSGGSKGVISGESANGVEDIEVFAVASQAKALLEKAGYKVVLSRTTNPDRAKLALWQKGNAAEVANLGRPADIAISIHTDSYASVGAGQIYYDKVGGYRQNNGSSFRQTFTNKTTAATSLRYAKVFQSVRGAYQKATVTMTAGHNFPASRGLGSFGDIPIVMLSAQSVPWVYNEFGRTSAKGLSTAQINLYVNSLVNATKQAIGPAAGSGKVTITCP